MVKPTLNVLEACSRLALIEGQKGKSLTRGVVTSEVKKEMWKAYLKKYAPSAILGCLVLVGMLLYWAGLPNWGINLFAGAFFCATLEILLTELNPKIGMALNFFIPGLGFMHCRRRYFILGGLALFFAFMTPQLSRFTVPSIILMAIFRFSTLTLQQVFWGIFSSSLFAALGYSAAKWVKKSEGGV